MVWYIGDPKISKAIKNLDAELERNSDRAVGILAGSIVETYLTSFLKGATRHRGSMWQDRTHPSGPLGSFAVKIDLLYMFGLISDEAHADLVIVKDIRNKFAHDLETEDFSTRSICDKCDALRLVESYVIGGGSLSEREILNLAGVRTFRIGGKGALEELKTPRLRYVWTARVFSMAFGMHRHSKGVAI